MRKKIFVMVVFSCLGVLHSCSQFTRADPDLLYSCIDSFPIETYNSEKELESRVEDRQLEAFEFCLKRS